MPSSRDAPATRRAGRSRADLPAPPRHVREAGRPETVLHALDGLFRDWLEPKLASGAYYGFVAEREGLPIGGVGLMTVDWPPHPSHPADARRGYVLNVFVDPAHRGRGVARALMAAAEAEFVRRGLTYAFLHATAVGRPLYESSGWDPTSELAKALGTD